MANYYMLGGDGKEYGPASAEQLRQWLVEGRANAQTQVRLAEKAEFVPLGMVPELSPNPTAEPAASTAPSPAFSQSQGPTSYFMRGGDGREYGPVTGQQLRQWMMEGRANAQTLVRAASGGPLVALGMVAEFSGGATARPAAASLPLAHALAQSSSLGAADDGAQVKRLASIVAAGSAWMKAFAVLMFILAAILSLTIIGLVISWLPLWQGVVMWGAASRAQQAVYTGSEQDLALSLEKLRQTFRLGVIMVIALVIFNVVMQLLSGALTGALHNMGGGMGGF